MAVLMPWAPSFAQTIYRPQDTTGALASYEVLGVHLGIRTLASASGNLPDDKPRTSDAKL